MTKDKIKTLLDFVPIIILAIYSVGMFWTISTTNIILQSEHYIGLAFLVISAGLFLYRHKLGVLFLGLTLLFGLFKILAYSAIISFHSFGGSINGHSSPEIKVQAIFLLWLLIYFIISCRHYVGIVTKKYWQDIFNKSTKEVSNT